MDRGDLIRNGMSAAELGERRWVKSGRSGPNGGNCVELATIEGERVAVRNSRFPQGPALIFGRDEIEALIADTKSGALDHLLG